MKNTILSIIALLSIGCKDLGANDTLIGKPIPNFTIQLVDSVSMIHLATDSDNVPFVLFIFDPECSFCQAELTAIKKHDKLLKNVKLYMITYVSYGKMVKFYKDFEIGKYKNIILGRDSTLASLRYFNLTGVPFTAIYDKRLLKRTYNRRIDAKEIFEGVYE